LKEVHTLSYQPTKTKYSGSIKEVKIGVGDKAVTVGGKTHKVEVRRKPWLAIGEIKVDDKLVAMFAAKAMSITIFNYRQQPFWIEDEQFSVVIKPNFFGYNFDLMYNGELIEPDPVS